MRFGRHGAALALACVLLWTGPAGANPPDARARARVVYDQAKEHFRSERYERAARTFRRAHGIYPTARLLYNEALAWEKAGDRASAANALSEYLASPDATDRAEAAKWLEALVRKLERTHGRIRVVLSPIGKHFLLAGKRHRSPWAGWLEPGSYALVVDAPGFARLERPVTVRAGTQTDEEHTLVARPPSPTPMPAGVAPQRKPPKTAPTVLARPKAPPETPRPSRVEGPPPTPANGLAIAGWVLLGSGVAAAVGGLVANVAVGLPRATSAGELDPTAPDYDAEFDRVIEEADTINTVGYALYGVGGGLALTGAILLIIDSLDSTRPDDSSNAVGASVDPTGRLTVWGRF